MRYPRWVRVVVALWILGAVASDARADEPAPRLAGARNVDGDEAPGHVAFTFDDGPDRETTPGILELLDDAGIKATFFVVGHRFSGKGEIATANRAILSDEIARGHMVGNHTFRHTNLRDTPEKEALEDVDKNQRAIERALGAGAVLFRPPYGATSPEIRKALRKRKYVTVNWTIDSGDFKTRKAEKVAAHVMKELLARDGGVVLMHDTKPWTVEALRLILEALEVENCRRLAAGERPILPVELDRFARGADGAALPLPDDVLAREQATRERLEKRCRPAVDNPSGTD